MPWKIFSSDTEISRKSVAISFESIPCHFFFGNLHGSFLNITKKRINMIYIYKIVDSRIPLSESDLNEYGEEGWLLCDIGSSEKGWCYIFAKMVESPLPL